MGSDFERELNIAHKSASNLFFDAEMERCLNHTTRDFVRMQAESNTEMKNVFDAQPVLLWSTSNRFNRNSEHSLPFKSKVAQDGRQPTISHAEHLDRFVRPTERVATSVFNMLMGVAEVSALSSAMEERGNALVPTQSGFCVMTLGALFGDQSPEIIAWQQQNRQRAPFLARESDALQGVNPLQVAKGFGRGIKSSFIEAGEFIGEEAARLRLGERTKIGSIVKATGTFLGEEAARLTLHEETQTERFAKVVDTFIYEEAGRFRLGEETKTQALIFRGLQKLCEMPAEELTYHLGKFGGDILTGYGLTQGLKHSGKVLNLGLESVLGGSSGASLSANPIPLSLRQGGFLSVGGVTLEQLKQRDVVLKGILNKAQRGIGSVQIHSVTDAMRLNAELALKQAGILCERGKLTSHALFKPVKLKEGIELNNPKVVQELTKDGSQMANWAKYTTKEAVALSNGQKVQVHFYQNKITGEVNKNIDYKITPEVLPARVYKRKQ